MASDDHLIRLRPTKIRREPRGGRDLLLRRRPWTTPQVLIVSILLAALFLYTVYNFAMACLDYAGPA